MCWGEVAVNTATGVVSGAIAENGGISVTYYV